MCSLIYPLENSLLKLALLCLDSVVNRHQLVLAILTFFFIEKQSYEQINWIFLKRLKMNFPLEA
jgi:hypothetical protein